jgi:hypothetical protein
MPKVDGIGRLAVCSLTGERFLRRYGGNVLMQCQTPRPCARRPTRGSPLNASPDLAVEHSRYCSHGEELHDANFLYRYREGVGTLRLGPMSSQRDHER